MTETIRLNNIREEHNATLCYAAWIALSEAVGVLAGIVTRSGVQYFNNAVKHPPLTAPSWFFPVAWAILYAIMGIGAARVYTARRSASRTRALCVFSIQLVFNFFWTILFFNVAAYALSLVWLAALFAISAAMTVAFYRIDDTAGMMQIPYLAWIGYAAYINAGVWLMAR